MNAPLLVAVLYVLAALSSAFSLLVCLALATINAYALAALVGVGIESLTLIALGFVLSWDVSRRFPRGP